MVPARVEGMGRGQSDKNASPVLDGLTWRSRSESKRHLFPALRACACACAYKLDSLLQQNGTMKRARCRSAREASECTASPTE